MNATYSNRLSRRLLQSVFKNQWVVPRKPSPVAHGVFKFVENVIARPRPKSQTVDRPIFIMSLPRSGSSMLQDLLSAHDGLGYITNMMHLFWPCHCGADMVRRWLNLNVEGERFLKDSVMVQGGTPSDPVAAWNDWYDQDPDNLEFQPTTPEMLGEERIRRMQLQIQKLLWCFRSSGDVRFLCKNPGLIAYMELTAKLFPDAKFIYLIRDPRKNANSMRKLYRLCEEQRANISWKPPELVPYPRFPRLGEYISTYGADSLETTARLWRDASIAMKPWEDSPQVHTIRFEDLLASPQEKISEIMNFCELSPEGAENDTFRERLGKVGVVSHRNPSYDGFERIEEICSDEMKRWGYA